MTIGAVRWTIVIRAIAAWRAKNELPMLGVVHDLWISMAGSAGVGKSTLTQRLGTTLRQRRTPVDAFGEEELFTRSEFVRVADGFVANTMHPPKSLKPPTGPG